jgi:hypothetical protein|tara:strand:+ start:283 stop:594 length:312 start_codon:yes stop_codon:yes gene_type:complete
MKDNKLIAEFMGIESFKDSLASLHQGKINVDVDVYEQAQYHTSWDWLMLVLKKINLHLHPDTYGLWRMINTPTEYTIEEVHAQVVEFIKEYNDEQRENNQRPS